ncbi:hypothetical protein [Bacillus sp. ISL-7]|uniref:hypothetical protein n=1 Tax=Bacillus sp. ISL-7 TaxID=2819136 RepID=UPI001BE6BD56|nr:hypothetical protein [Bacillus sp. ISL-7]MBT2735180.1 hypothetical protein [Bacillus sp. ISL-7]
MNVYEYTLPVLAGLKGQVKSVVKANNHSIPCRVIATIKFMRYGKYPVQYKFDFLIEEGPGQMGMVAQELDHWMEELEATTRDLLKDIPTNELAEILAERLKVTS